MLGATGIIKLEEAQAIQTGLEELLADYGAGKLVFDIRNEDIHMNIESLLTAKIGGRWQGNSTQLVLVTIK